MAETAIASDLVERTLYRGEKVNIEYVNKKLDEWQSYNAIELTKDQRTAVIRSLMDNVTIVTGGPGTGKTSMLAALLYVADSLKMNALLAAPTGRAAKRMQETTSRDSSTIHRLLGYGQEGKFGFQYNKDNKLEGDIVVVDEISMVDLLLMDALLKAIPKETKVILVGDKDQLQSVGAGNVLSDMMASGKLNTIELKEIFRQASNSLLVKNAAIINSGHVKNNKNPLKVGDKWGPYDFYHTPRLQSSTILEVLTDHIPNKYNIPASDVMVLSPIRKKRGDLNCTSLNELIQATLNPNGESIPIINQSFRVGDKVMQMSNDYSKNVFNGDIGYITRVYGKTENGAGAFFVDFYGNEVMYEFSEANSLTHAWASTIHKAQGGESDAVIVVLPDDYMASNMLTRNLLYTGITRAKKVCILMGKDRHIIKAITTSGIAKRYTNLSEKINEAYLQERYRRK